MSVALVVVSDRGPLYLPGCMESIKENADFFFVDRILVDDREHKLGMAGAVRQGFAKALDSGADFAFWVEEDFRFNGPVPLDTMAYIVDRAPYLAQVVLKRQPWSPEEVAAGGIVEMHPGEYFEHRAMRQAAVWTEHQRIFSLNPCLIPRRVLELGWPDGNEAEMTRRCVEAGFRFAFYGAKFAPPLVTHVGEVRSQGWRL